MSEEKIKEKPDIKEPLATFNQRLIAGLIDYLIVWGAIIIGIILNSVLYSIVPIVGIFLGILFYLVGFVAFFFIFIWYPYKNDGQSIGKKQQKIKIKFLKEEGKWILRSVQEGDMVQLLIRAIIGWFEVSIVPIVIAWYFITNDKNSQRLADQVAKTAVVQAEAETTKKTTTKKTSTKEEEKK